MASKRTSAFHKQFWITSELKCNETIDRAKINALMSGINV